jgi:hypothetical protein
MSILITFFLGFIIEGITPLSLKYGSTHVLFGSAYDLKFLFRLFVVVERMPFKLS